MQKRVLGLNDGPRNDRGQFQCREQLPVLPFESTFKGRQLVYSGQVGLKILVSMSS
jgi:hypothetical protein